VAMAAGYTQLNILKNNPEIYTKMNATATQLFEGINEILSEHKAKCTLNYVGSLGSVFFTESQVKDYALAKTSDTIAFTEYFKYMLNHGIYIAPSQFEAMFVSAAIGEAEVMETLKTIRNYFEAIV